MEGNLSSRVMSPLGKIMHVSQRLVLVSAVSIVAGAVGFIVTTRPPVALALLIAGLSFVSPLWVVLGAAIVSQHIIPGPLDDMVGELTAADLLLMVVVLRWLAGVVAHPLRLQAVFKGPGAWLIAFFAWAWFSLVVTDSWHVTGLALGRVSLYGAVFLALSSERWNPSSLFRFIAYFAAFEATLALLGVTPSEELRAQGVYGDPGIFGFLMLAGLASSVILRGYPRGIVTILVLIGVALSFTRGIWVAAIIGLALIIVPALTRRSLRVLAAAVVILSMAVISLPTVTEALGLNPESPSLRYESWENAVDLIVEHPVVGIGWAGGRSGWPSAGESGPQVAARQPYNLWLNTAAATGVVGSIVLTVWLGLVFLFLRRARNRAGRAGLIYLVQTSVFSLAAMILFASSSTAIEFFVLLGAGLSSTRQQSTARDEGRASARSLPG